MEYEAIEKNVHTTWKQLLNSNDQQQFQNTSFRKNCTLVRQTIIMTLGAFSI